MANRKLRYSGLGLAVLTVGAIAACSSTDAGTPSGGAGSGTAGAHTGGAPGTAGSGTAGLAPTAGSAGAATAGTGTGGGSGGASAGFACTGPKLSAPLITNFDDLVAGTSGSYTFMAGIPGGTFAYQTGVLTLDITGMQLNLKGNVKPKAYDGFGLYFNSCQDASAYTGVSFNIKGNVGPTGKINFRIQTNENTFIDTVNSKGACVSTAADSSAAYPDCHSASFDIPVTAAGGVVMVNFSQLSGGMPSATVKANQIVGLEWAFADPPAATTGTAGAGAGGASGGSGGASAGAGGASAGAGGKAGSASGGSASGGGASGGATSATTGPYDVDVTIDNVMFIGGPAAGGSGGAGAGGSGGAAVAGGSGGASGGTGGASAGTGGKAGSGG